METLFLLALGFLIGNAIRSKQWERAEDYRWQLEEEMQRQAEEAERRRWHHPLERGEVRQWTGRASTIS